LKKLAALLLLVVLLTMVPFHPSRATADPIHLAVPVDTASSSVWNSVLGASPAVGLVILNPANGPGTRAEAQYSTDVSRAQHEGVKVVGYLYTGYDNGSVTLSAAETQIDEYFSWYHADGVFIDQVNSSCAPGPSGFYESLYSHTKLDSPNATVVLNPGTVPGQCYAAYSDILLTFEDTLTVYEGAYAQAGWADLYPRGHFYHVVLGVPNSTAMERSVDTALQRGAGWVFVTDRDTSSGNPYSSLPSYFGT
jgi:Spherulation-specific family 4